MRYTDVQDADSVQLYVGWWLNIYVIDLEDNEYSDSQSVTMDGKQEIAIRLSFIIPELPFTVLLLAMLTLALQPYT